MEMARFVVEAHVREGRTVAEIAATHGISQSWIYELLVRYRSEGDTGLAPRSKRPKHCPTQIAADVEDEIVFIRKTLAETGVDAGAETISYHLAKKFAAVPSPSTIWRVLRQRGMVTPQPRKRPKSSYIRFEASLPNETWQSDVTHWQLADGTDVEILNYLDDHSRFSLASVALPVTKATDVVKIFHDTAQTYGYPASLLTDNGAIYTARFRNGKVLMEYVLEQLGITYKHSKPNHPTTQGKIERWHQTLKKYLAKQPAAQTITDLQQQLDTFVNYYNQTRPHRALNRKTPQEIYDTKIKAHPTNTTKTENYRVRNDKIDKEGTVTLRYRSKLHHIYVGRAHKHQQILMLIDNQDIRIINQNGELLRHFQLDPTRNYQPMNSGQQNL